LTQQIFFDDVPVDVGKAKIPLVEAVGDLLRASSQEVEAGGVQILNLSEAIYEFLTEYVRSSID
jgi:hypothetical protein